MTGERAFVVVGGAVFIGSHFVARLLADPATARVTVYDNFSSGRDWHLAPHAGDRRLAVVRGELAVHRLAPARRHAVGHDRSEEHTSELQSLMRISYAVFCLKQKTTEKKKTVLSNQLHVYVITKTHTNT